MELDRIEFFSSFSAAAATGQSVSKNSARHPDRRPSYPAYRNMVSFQLPRKYRMRKKGQAKYPVQEHGCTDADGAVSYIFPKMKPNRIRPTHMDTMENDHGVGHIVAGAEHVGKK